VTWLLVADDDDDLREQLVELLADRGYEVRSARHGGEVMDLLDAASEPPAALVLDMLMPRMSGREVLRAMLVHRTDPGVPVVVLSGVAVEESELEGYPVAAVLLKPVTTQALVDAIERARGVS
jgi:CheY-like chemotaxis protein